MNFDPIDLYEEASLAVLSVDGNFCTRILARYDMLVKERKI